MLYEIALYKLTTDVDIDVHIRLKTAKFEQNRVRLGPQ